ncbi:MAG: hypothetical protein ACE5IY_12635 [bacterium]
MIITIHKHQFPEQFKRTTRYLKQKNRVQCRKAFMRFPKRAYADFCLDVAKIVQLLRNLNEICLEGKATIRLENGVRTEAGYLSVYQPRSRAWHAAKNLDRRLNTIKDKLDEMAVQFDGEYLVEFRLRQWIEPLNSGPAR